MGGKQFGFDDYEESTAKKQTNRKKFLAKMEQVVPWQPLIDLIVPFYPKRGFKRPLALSTGDRAPDSLDSALVLIE